MTWWCAASTLPWTWSWTAYPGVWLFILALIGWYWRFGRTPGDRRAGIRFGIGVFLLWIALDWPLGALGGYLASAHTGQFLLIALSVPPFLLLGIRPRLENPARPNPVLGLLARPLVAFVGYNVIVIGTHMPVIVDSLMASQLGSFLLDLLWLAGGLMLWWPALAPAPYQRLTAPLQMGYLFLQTVPASLPAAFLVFAAHPLYELYELAPRVSAALTPYHDHQVAGLLMKMVGDPIVWVGIGIIFFRWAGAERRADLTGSAAQAGGGGRPGLN